MTIYDDQNDITVHLLPLPGNVRAFSFSSDEGFVVVLNILLSFQALRQSYSHELNHIAHHDHSNEDYLEYNEM